MFICPTERYSLFADDWVRLRGQNSERGAATPVLRTAGSEGKRPRISINATHFRSSSPNQYDHYAGVWQRNPAVWLTAAFFIKSLLSCFIGFLDGPHSSVESVTKTNIGGNWRGGGGKGTLQRVSQHCDVTSCYVRGGVYAHTSTPLVFFLM